jgi:hypothetical protein
VQFVCGEIVEGSVKGEQARGRAEAMVLFPGDVGYELASRGASLTREELRKIARTPEGPTLLGWRRLDEHRQADGSLVAILPMKDAEPFRLVLNDFAGCDPQATLVRAFVHWIPLRRFEGGRDPFAGAAQRWEGLLSDVRTTQSTRAADADDRNQNDV